MCSAACRRFTSSTMVTRLLVLFALVAAAAALGFTSGHATATTPTDPRGTWDDGYHAGVKAQRNAAPTAAGRVRARYEPGADGYEKIYEAGMREGRRLGRIAGATSARAATLPDFAGGWRPAHWYMV